MQIPGVYEYDASPRDKQEYLRDGFYAPYDDEVLPEANSHSAAESAVLAGGYSVAVSTDSASLFVAGAGGLARLDAAALRLEAHAPYTGAAKSASYADVAAGDNYVVCVDLDGTLFAHDPATCSLRFERPYEPTVFETSQRIVGGQLKKFNAGISGLEGGLGHAPRLAAGRSAVFLGGRDGVLTALAPGGLNVVARARLSEGPQAIGVQLVYLSPNQQHLYAGVLSVLHVLTPALQTVAKLRGGPRVPVFGNVCSVAETHDGCYAFSGDVGGPSVHMWETSTWQWLARVELTAGGGPATHLALEPSDCRILYVATEWGRFLAFDVARLPLQCIQEGGGGGPLVFSRMNPGRVIVLAEGRLHLRRAER